MPAACLSHSSVRAGSVASNSEASTAELATARTSLPAGDFDAASRHPAASLALKTAICIRYTTSRHPCGPRGSFTACLQHVLSPCPSYAVAHSTCPSPALHSALQLCPIKPRQSTSPPSRTNSTCICVVCPIFPPTGVQGRYDKRTQDLVDSPWGVCVQPAGIDWWRQSPEPQRPGLCRAAA